MKQSMSASARPSILRKVLEEQLSVLAGELASLHEQELAPREISPALVEAFGHKPDDRAYILPVLVRARPVGVIYAAGGVEMAPLELLAQAAALALEARMRPETPLPQPPPAPAPARKPELV